VRALIRVGLDRIEGYVTPETLAHFAVNHPLRRTETIDFREMESRRVRGLARVLDVRGLSEYESGHVDEAIHIPHTRAATSLEAVPRDRPILVYCNSGARAAAAAALLERHGHDAVAVSDLFVNYRRSELLTSAAE
jgi:hydroxyacylglutathione hydrolase